MNFRPTKKKLILSLVLLIITTIVTVFVGLVYFCQNVQPTCEIGVSCPVLENPCTPLNPLAWISSFVVAGLPSFILVYIIYSLIERKKQ